MLAKICSIRSMVSDTGCRPPGSRMRPGSETSSASAFSCASSSASARACRRSLSAASIACLAWLMAAPRVFFSSTESAARPFISSVMRPDLPTYCALAFSRSAGVPACANAARAPATIESNSWVMKKTGLAPCSPSPVLMGFAPAAAPVGTRQPPRNSGSQLGLHLVHDAGKRRGVVVGDIGQDLAVDVDAGFPDPVGELAVGQAVRTRGGVDTGDPQLAEDALLGTTVAVGILPRLHHRFLGDAEDVTAAAAETLGEREDLLVTGACRYTTFDARHVCSPSSSTLDAGKRQHLRHVTHVGLMDGSRAAQVALVLGGLLGQD